MTKLKLLLKQFYHRFVSGNRRLASYYRWRRHDGDATRRYSYELNENSLVVDAGGFRGDFAAEIYRRFGCTVIVFEPVVEYYEQIKDRFKHVARILAEPKGLSDRSQECLISVSGSSSSRYTATNDETNTVRVEMTTLDDYLSDHQIEQVDLLKLNIEGGEYDVIDSLLRTGSIKHVTDIQIQFHDFVDGADRRRERLQRELSKTHTKTWDYPFVWESWHRNR